MKVLIVYNTVTGYTERYADFLLDELQDAEKVALKKFKPKMLNACDRVVFLSRVTNNVIDGFKTVVKHAEKFAEKYVCVVAVGMSEDTPEHYYALEQANVPYKLKGIPLFCVRGGFDAEKLTGKNKLMIKLMKMQLTGAKSRSPEEMAILNFLQAKTDKTDRAQLHGVLDYLKTGRFDAPPELDGEEVAESPFWMTLEEYMPKSIVSDAADATNAADADAGANAESADALDAETKAPAQDSAFSAGGMKE